MVDTALEHAQRNEKQRGVKQVAAREADGDDDDAMSTWQTTLAEHAESCRTFLALQQSTDQDKRVQLSPVAWLSTSLRVDDPLKSRSFGRPGTGGGGFFDPFEMNDD